MDAFLAMLGQTIAVAALVQGGIIRAGDLFVVTDPMHACIFDGARVHRLPAWASRHTVAAMGAAPALVVEKFCRSSGDQHAVWS